MNNLAESLEAIVEAQTNSDDQLELVVVEIDSRQESLTENFNEEIDAWARHSLALNGFADY